jgi:hypothetical protein
LEVTQLRVGGNTHGDHPAREVNLRHPRALMIDYAHVVLERVEVFFRDMLRDSTTEMHGEARDCMRSNEVDCFQIEIRTVDFYYEEMIDVLAHAKS